MSEKVTDLLKEIKTNLSQTSASQKDEIRVMQAMLNDESYEVGVYGKAGKEDSYCPAKDFRAMASGIISGAAKISGTEAASLVADYEFKKSDARTMVNISKEFVNTFVQTGRKLPLGSREKSDISLAQKVVEATTRSYPQKVGVNEDGSARYSKATTGVAAHDSMRVYAPCPSWVK